MLETISINTEDFFKNALNTLKLDKNRRQLLTSIAQFIAEEIKANKKVNLNYICTHNSRRSQLAQVWSSYACNYFKLSEVNSFSGGTAITAFYRNTVKTLQEVGFNFQIVEFSHQNPVYAINYKNCIDPIIGYSKLYDDEYNKKPFIAIITCSNAEENCPFIPDTIERFHLPFNDPKSFDNSLNQAEKYMETNKQIAGEIHFIFEKIKMSI
jgi:arsenate reductase (thioredoxin)